MREPSRRLPRVCLALALGVAAGCRDRQPPLPEATRPAPPAAAPAPRDLPLTPGAAVEATLAGVGVHRYRLTLAPDQFADLVVDQRGLDVVARLTGPAGTAFPPVDSPNDAWGPEPLPALGAPGGSLILEIRPATPAAAPGRYAVRVNAVRPATGADRRRVAAERELAMAEGLRRAGGGASLRAAAERAEGAAAALRGLGAHGRTADAFYAASRARKALGEREAELRDLRAALPAFRALGDRRAVGRTLNSLGPLHLALGQPDAALACYRESLPILAALGDRRGEATALNNLGRAQATLGHAEEALAAYDRALALWRRLGLRDFEGQTLANRGSLFASLGQTARALDDFDRAVPRLAGRPEAAGALADRGFVLTQGGRTAEAAADLRGALALQRRAGDRRGEAVTLNSLGVLREEEGLIPEARQAFEQAVAAFAALADRPNEAAALVNLGRLLDRQGDAAAAEAAFRRALASFAAAGRRAGEAAAWLGLAQARRAQGDPWGALRAVRPALERVEALRAEPGSFELRISFLASYHEVFAFAVDLAMELHAREPGAGHDTLALEISERARARGLLDALVEAHVRRSAAARTAFRPLSLREIRAGALDPGAVLLEYALGERRSFLWVVSAGRLTSHVLPPRAILENAARRAHAALADGNRTLARSETAAALADLSRLLLAPAAAALADRRLVVVVPDGALYLVPFAALPDPGALADPLLARREVVAAPSASALAAIRRGAADRRPAPAVVAVLADPVFDAADPRVRRGGGRPAAARFARLPFSREEARSLLALAPPGERLAALDFAARRELATSGALARFRVVHFATHAVLDPERPELSGIALSMVDEAGRPRDGFLRSREIYRLRLAADLVVLSACETALGREVRGEGVVGLTRAFLHAGARRVLVSLWPVEDQATTRLMRRFYEGLFRRGLSPAAALRQAQDEARRTPGGQDPYFWAGFILQGDPR